jgi:DNA-3-methyladenine glycosylase
MAKDRNIDISTGMRSKYKNLTNGPSKLCQAMDIDTSLNGIDLCADELFIISGKTFKDKEILNVPRVNIGYVKEYKDKKWRFILKNNEFISKYPKQ